jgi:hypothetical protein
MVQFSGGMSEGDLKGIEHRHHETHEDGHGRIDDRSYDLAVVPGDFACGEDWPWVKAIGCTVRITRHANGSETDEVRYYLSSRYLSGQRFADAVRGHWGIEIPQPEDLRSDNLCAVGRAGYHRRRRPVGVGRVERQKRPGPRRHLMLTRESVCVPPRPRILHRIH